MSKKVLCVALLASLAACGGGDAGKSNRTFDDSTSTGPIVNFEESDREMNDAMAAARRDIAIFRDRLANPTPTQQIGLKGGFGSGDDREHMWIDSPRIDGDGFAGTLANEPVYLSTPKHGDAVKIGVDEVSDWYVYDEGKVQGAYTLRIIRRQLGTEARKAFDESMGFALE
jgi:uncharacterized protein YegJ (DUF2314 family)